MKLYETKIFMVQTFQKYPVSLVKKLTVDQFSTADRIPYFVTLMCIQYETISC